MGNDDALTIPTEEPRMRTKKLRSSGSVPTVDDENQDSPAANSKKSNTTRKNAAKSTTTRTKKRKGTPAGVVVHDQDQTIAKKSKAKSKAKSSSPAPSRRSKRGTTTRCWEIFPSRNVTSESFDKNGNELDPSLSSREEGVSVVRIRDG